MDELIEWNNYTFRITQDELEEDILHIEVSDSNITTHNFPVFRLQIKELWRQENTNFKEGDYWQETMNRENLFDTTPHVSYAAITHDFLISNGSHFPKIKNIFSTRLDGLDVSFITVDAIKFWNRQVEKGIATQEGNRFRVIVNH